MKMFIVVPSGSFPVNGSKESGAEEALENENNARKKQVRKAIA
jgi:hypothetical protein